MLKQVSIIVGSVFVLVGIAGFLGGFGIVGMSGIFKTDMLHDVVHLVIGLAIIYAATSKPASLPMFLKVFGVIYLVLAIIGLMSADGSILGIVAANKNDVYLHLVLGVVVLALPFMFRNDRV